MLRRVTLSTVLGLCLFLGAGFAQSPEYLTILHLNDTHGNLAPGAPRDAEGNATIGGIARAATVIGMEKMMDPNALVLHAGDAFIGDPAFNLSWAVEPPVMPELQMLQSLGLDAMALGNHEFDLGCEALEGTLLASLGETPFPLLCGNLDMSAEPELMLVNHVTPHVILQSGNVSVGIFSMVTPEVAMTETATLQHGPDDIEALFALIGAQVMELRGQNCDVVIFLSHCGYMLDMAVAATIPGIDLIIGGHDHLALEEAAEVPNAGGSTWIVQSGAFYRSMGKTTLKIDGGAVSLEEYSLLPLDAAVMEYPDMKTTCDGIYAMLDAATQGLLFTTVGAATGFLTEEIKDCMVEGNLDTHLGNLCADAYAAATGADFAFQPGGSTAQPIYPGPIKVLDLFRSIGYGMNDTNALGFGLVTVDMTGEAILAGLEVTLLFAEMNDEMLIHPSSELAYSFNPAADSLMRIISVEVNGAQINPSSTYTVAFNELLLSYFDYLSSMDPRITYTNPVKLGSPTLPGPLTEVEALAGYVAAVQPLAADPLPGRVTGVITHVYEAPVPTDRPRLGNNYPNPFSRSTSFMLTVPSRTHVRVAVYDVMGRQVAEIADAEFIGGRYELHFPAKDLPAGLYQCRMTNDNAQQTVPMLLLR